MKRTPEFYFTKNIKYQIWGQTEKASAFERKFAREKLKIDCDLLKDKTSAKQVVEKYLNFIDFETKTMKEATIQLTHFPSNKDAVINYIHRKQKQIKMESPNQHLWGGDRTFLIKKVFKVVETFGNVR